MTDTLYPDASADLAKMRKQLGPEQDAAFKAFGKAVFAAGALDAKTKQLIAIAVAHATQCPYCIRGHTKAALKAGATGAEVMEAVWVAAEMRAGAAFAHSLLALDELAKAEERAIPVRSNPSFVSIENLSGQKGHSGRDRCLNGPTHAAVQRQSVAVPHCQAPWARSRAFWAISEHSSHKQPATTYLKDVSADLISYSVLEGSNFGRRKIPWHMPCPTLLTAVARSSLKPLSTRCT